MPESATIAGELVEPLAFEIESADPNGFEMQPGELRPPKVLVVEDDFLLSAVIQKRLSACGLDVSRAFTGGEGYWMAVNERPNLIITDHVMPDALGSYLLRRLRENASTATIPVIVLTGCDIASSLTGHSEQSLERCFLSLGADCVLRKPLDYQALLGRMRRYIRIAESLRAVP